MTLIGTATIKRRLNSIFRSSSFGVDPRIKEPPEENGLMALDCAPITVHAKSAEELKPADAARFGISGNSAGATTPVVELKKLMIAPTMLNAIGTRGFGTLEPIQVDSSSIVPASTATAISIPAPAIMTIVFHGILAIASFCGASFNNKAITAKIIATRPTSTLLLMYLIAEFPGIRTCKSGKIKTMTIISIIRVRVVF